MHNVSLEGASSLEIGIVIAIAITILALVGWGLFWTWHDKWRKK